MTVIHSKVQVWLRHYEDALGTHKHKGRWKGKGAVASPPAPLPSVERKSANKTTTYEKRAIHNSVQSPSWSPSSHATSCSVPALSLKISASERSSRRPSTRDDQYHLSTDGGKCTTSVCWIRLGENQSQKWRVRKMERGTSDYPSIL